MQVQAWANSACARQFQRGVQCGCFFWCTMPYGDLCTHSASAPPSPPPLLFIPFPGVHPRGLQCTVSARRSLDIAPRSPEGWSFGRRVEGISPFPFFLLLWSYCRSVADFDRAVTERSPRHDGAVGAGRYPSPPPFSLSVWRDDRHPGRCNETALAFVSQALGQLLCLASGIISFANRIPLLSTSSISRRFLGPRPQRNQIHATTSWSCTSVALAMPPPSAPQNS